MENLDDMNRKDNEIRHILQGPLGEGDHHWAEPGDHVWTGIESALLEKKKRSGFWWWFGGALSLILLVLFLIPNGTDSASLAMGEVGIHRIQTPDQQSESNTGLEASMGEKESGNLTDNQAGKRTRSEGLYDDRSNQRNIDQKIQNQVITEESKVDLNRSSFPEGRNTIVPVDADKETTILERVRSAEPELRANNELPIRTTPFIVTQPIPSKLQEVTIPDDQELPPLSLANPGMSAELNPSSVQHTSHHRLLIYGHGIGADRRIERKSNVNIFDPEFGHTNTQFRIGAGYEFQHKSGIFAGTGIEYQDFHERVDKEKKWIYTKKNATQVGSDLFQQNIPVVINSGFGTASTTLRVDISENSLPTDYQEGDPVIFKMTVDHSLQYIRVPLYLGYHYEWRRWFGEIRGGSGLQIYLGSKSQVTRVAESRGKIMIRETESVNQLKHVRPAIWDLQGGVYAGYRWSTAWSVSCGYEYWQSLQSVVDRPNISTFTSGSGIQLALRRSF